MKTSIDRYEEGLRLYKLHAITAKELLELANEARASVGLKEANPQEFLTCITRRG
jgi:hypothetical protein